MEPTAEERRARNPLTRRTIVQSGAKLAYAAPLVAASFRLTGAGALGQSASTSPFCTASTNCAAGITLDCGPIGAEMECQCLRTVDGDIRCGADFFCGETPDCEDNADCADLHPGAFCQAVGSGCCSDEVSVCVPPCGVVVAVARVAAVDGAGQRTNRGR